MIKSELIAKLATENPHLTQKDVERVVSVIFDRMTEALVDGGRVELRGFGAFSVRARPARAGRNPRTGQAVAVDAKAAPLFKAGKEMRARLNVFAGGTLMEVRAKAVPFFKSGKELRERLNASGDA